LSLFQNLPFDRIHFLEPLGKRVTSGWQLLNITTLTSGSPFHGIFGNTTDGRRCGRDRSSRFGYDAGFFHEPGGPRRLFRARLRQCFVFSIPIKIPGGTGPNQRSLWNAGAATRSAGRRSISFDFALIKDTSFGPARKNELGILELRAEFFNLFNIVNFGLPSNTVRGSGFGLISRTAGTSRQIQFSLKLIY